MVSAEGDATKAQRSVRYSTIVADPPWNQKGGPLQGGVGEGFVFADKQRSRDLPYPTMSIEAIKALPIEQLAADDAHLYLWATNKYLPAAFEVVTAWGFTYSTTLVWAKNLMGGGLGGAYRVSTEFAIFARRGKLAETDTVRGTWFNWKRPYDARGKPRHSAKPPEFFEMIERVSPGPRLELFARSLRDGWHVWGNEVDSDIALAADSPDDPGSREKTRDLGKADPVKRPVPENNRANQVRARHRTP